MSLTTDDFDNAKLDLQFISKIANVAYNSNTATNRDGDVVDTVIGRLSKLGYLPPIAYAGSISFGVNDKTKTVDRLGVIYAPIPSSIPFTTSGTWIGQDENKFFVVQDSGTITALQADVADLTTLSGVASNQTTLGSFAGDAADVIDANSKIKEAFSDVANYARKVQRHNWNLIDTITITNVSAITIPIDSTEWREYLIECRSIAPNAGAGTYVKAIFNNDASNVYSAMTSTESTAWSHLGLQTRFVPTQGGHVSTDDIHLRMNLEFLNGVGPAHFYSVSSGMLYSNPFLKRVDGVYNVFANITSLKLEWQSQTWKAQGFIKVYAR